VKAPSHIDQEHRQEHRQCKITVAKITQYVAVRTDATTIITMITNAVVADATARNLVSAKQIQRSWIFQIRMLWVRTESTQGDSGLSTICAPDCLTRSSTQYACSRSLCLPTYLPSYNFLRTCQLFDLPTRGGGTLAIREGRSLLIDNAGQQVLFTDSGAWTDAMA
jgi:hypothetical protein